jgi:membrane-bound lytic murein transglycosylase D
MNRKIKYISAGVIFVLVCGTFICGITEIKNLDREYRELFRKHYRIFTPEVPEKADFAGENAPLELIYVRESFEREIFANTFMHSSTILMFKRANRWFPVIEPILKRNNIPDDFKFLAIAESNFANVVSPSGAEGFWQFLKPTGQKYGLEITEEVDERYNVEKATEAACRYFQEAYSKYHSWSLVAASYNRGLDGLSRALENQKVNSFYDLFLNDETARYLFRIMAIKEVYNHPVRYGYYLRSSDFYPPVPVYTVTVDTSISDLADFAFKQKINYRILREFNPWIRRYNLPNKSGKTYTFILPKEGYLNYETLMKKMPQSETFFHDSLKINQIN